MSVYRPGNSRFYHYDFHIKRRRFHGSTGCRAKAEAREVEKQRKIEATALIANECDGGSMTIDVAWPVLA